MVKLNVKHRELFPQQSKQCVAGLSPAALCLRWLPTITPEKTTVDLLNDGLTGQSVKFLALSCPALVSIWGVSQ